MSGERMGEPDRSGPPADCQAEHSTGTEPRDRESVNQAEHTSQSLSPVLVAFGRTSDPEELYAFWQQLPRDSAPALIAAIEQMIERAMQDGAQDLAIGLRQRLDALRQIQAQPAGQPGVAADAVVDARAAVPADV